MTKNAQEEMLKWIYAEHCQNNNFAVQTLDGNRQTQRASVSTFIPIYKGLKKTVPLLTILCWNYMRSWSYLGSFFPFISTGIN